MNDTQPPRRTGGPVSSGQPVVKPGEGYRSPFSGRTNLTEAEQQQLADRFKAAAVATPGYIYPAEHEIMAQPTAWQSLPKPIRFAVWLWAIAVIIGFMVGVVSLLFWLVTAGFIIFQM